MTATARKRAPGVSFWGQKSAHGRSRPPRKPAVRAFLTHAPQPALGRFISRDPIGFKGGLNLYGYVGANPIRAVDPMGLAAGDFDDPNANIQWLNQQADQSIDQGNFLTATGYRFLAVMVQTSGVTSAQNAGSCWGNPSSSIGQRVISGGSLGLAFLANLPIARGLSLLRYGSAASLAPLEFSDFLNDDRLIPAMSANGTRLNVVFHATENTAGGVDNLQSIANWIMANPNFARASSVCLCACKAGAASGKTADQLGAMIGKPVIASTEVVNTWLGYMLTSGSWIWF